MCYSTYSQCATGFLPVVLGLEAWRDAGYSLAQNTPYIGLDNWPTTYTGQFGQDCLSGMAANKSSMIPNMPNWYPGAPGMVTLLSPWEFWKPPFTQQTVPPYGMYQPPGRNMLSGMPSHLPHPGAPVPDQSMPLPGQQPSEAYPGHQQSHTLGSHQCCLLVSSNRSNSWC